MKRKKKTLLLAFIIIGILAIAGLMLLILTHKPAKPEPEVLTDQWGKLQGVDCYYDSEGNPVKGWVQIKPQEGSPNKEEWCYFDEAGKFVEDYDKSYADATTVFVDISEQMLTYFDNGVVKLHCHIISGTKGKSDTPTGEYAITGKNKDARITGSDWDYDHVVWMAFIGQEYGLHSAWWQDDELFEDPTTYYTNGSHGCVNMKEEDALKLFDMIEEGTKVILQD